MKVLEIRGPNTVKIKVPPRLARIEPIQNVVHLKPYHSRPQHIGPAAIQATPDVIDDHEEYEVEDILAHRDKGRTTEYLVRWTNCGPEDDLWIPKANLVNAPDILKAYHARQAGKASAVPKSGRQRARSHIRRLGHVWLCADLPAHITSSRRMIQGGEDVTSP